MLRPDTGGSSAGSLTHPTWSDTSYGLEETSRRPSLFESDPFSDHWAAGQFGALDDLTPRAWRACASRSLNACSRPVGSARGSVASYSAGGERRRPRARMLPLRPAAVSYTHLKLPT